MWKHGSALLTAYLTDATVDSLVLQIRAHPLGDVAVLCFTAL